ncbi:glycosyltransferase family 2 protein [Oricola cellulosilytica]|uniref:Glycosyltransferase family 2 protein n=1 Tax=Oricola cellulosilytica TaxID=1429082 RepID=A0A4R0PHU2_9HYPH|nr:glycosyltransferase family 2 protein [Oricola cellulosilytica]TCD15134.1 glycosyltransferase family 2 protein [Oricola cellulosilytica]
MSVSVVIPAHKRSAELPSAVGSVLRQTLPPDEIIIVDDGSTDGTFDVATELARGNELISVIKHSKNLGGSAARNSGWHQAKGDWIAFLDSDDSWHPKKLAKQFKIIETNPTAGMIYCGFLKVDSATRRVLLDRAAPSNEDWDQFKFDIASRNIIGTTSVAIIRKSFLIIVDGFDDNLPSCQDWDIYYRLSKHCKFDFAQESLVYYSASNVERISTCFSNATRGRKMIFDKIKTDYFGVKLLILYYRHYSSIGLLYRKEKKYL